MYILLVKDTTLANDLDYILRRRRLVLTISIGAILVMALIDLLVDRAEGIGWSHLIGEFLIGVFCLLSLLSLWWHTGFLSIKSHQKLSNQLDKTRADLLIWREKALLLLAGLGEAIQQQFESWHLTAAEQEVGLLLLKGLSIKEISTIRQTSEKTIRHQAAAVYKKAGVQGRSELAAFFLEDLLLPNSAAISSN